MVKPLTLRPDGANTLVDAEGRGVGFGTRVDEREDETGNDGEVATMSTESARLHARIGKLHSRKVKAKALTNGNGEGDVQIGTDVSAEEAKVVSGIELRTASRSRRTVLGVWERK